MSILEVKNLSHGFGDRAIFEDVSFRLLKGEHIGLVGANGEGKSTFMSIVTGKMLPDEGKVEWSKYVTAGYLDQHAVLEQGQSVRDVLRTAFDEPNATSRNGKPSPMQYAMTSTTPRAAVKP